MSPESRWRRLCRTRDGGTAMRGFLRVSGVVSALLTGALLLPVAGGDPVAPMQTPGRTVAALPDMSGMVWMAGTPSWQCATTRTTTVSASNLASALSGRRPRRRAAGLGRYEVRWPAPQGPSNDLESVARISGTRQVMLVDSGDDGSAFQRIFLATPTGRRLEIKETVSWPTPVWNPPPSARTVRSWRSTWAPTEAS